MFLSQRSRHYTGKLITSFHIFALINNSADTDPFSTLATAYPVPPSFFPLYSQRFNLLETLGCDQEGFGLCRHFCPYGWWWRAVYIF
jgi:hypothetical protein